MGEGRRTITIVVTIILIVALFALARGRDHRRGDEVGAFAPATVVRIAS